MHIYRFLLVTELYVDRKGQTQIKSRRRLTWRRRESNSHHHPPSHTQVCRELPSVCKPVIIGLMLIPGATANNGAAEQALSPSPSPSPSRRVPGRAQARGRRLQSMRRRRSRRLMVRIWLPCVLVVLPALPPLRVRDCWFVLLILSLPAMCTLASVLSV